MGFPGGSDGKEPGPSAGDPGSIPGLGQSYSFEVKVGGPWANLVGDGKLRVYSTCIFNIK